MDDGGGLGDPAEIVVRWPGGSLAIPTRPKGAVLDAMVAEGFPVLNFCRRGDCRQCVAIVVDGVEPEYDAASEIQLCRISASVAGVYELPDNPYVAVAAARLFPAKVARLTEVANDIFCLRLRVPPRQQLTFSGGQYASLTLKSGLTRAYSIAAHDAATNEVDFFIKRVEGGAFGAWLINKAAPGDLLQMRAPLGSFYLRPMASRATWFVATGTGIAPFLAMLRNASPELVASLGRLELLWGNRTSRDVFCESELRALSSRIGLNVRMAFTREGEANRVTDILSRSDLTDSVIYAAGHPGMIRDAHEIVVANHLPARRFFSDAFSFSSREQTNDLSDVRPDRR